MISSCILTKVISIPPTTHLLRGGKITLFRQLKCDLATVPHHPKKSSDVVLITQYAKSTKSMLLEGTVTISDGPHIMNQMTLH